MESFIIRGSNRLVGNVTISGAKNSALKLMAASLLSEDVSVLRNVPKIKDVYTMAQVLEVLGVGVDLSQGDQVIIRPGSHLECEAPYELVSQMRASIIVLGPLLARLGRARVAMPGGCNIGSRKIDLHIRGLETLGAQIEMGHGYLEARSSELRGRLIPLDFPSVGATENLLMAATLARGVTIIENAAREPEIVDLANFLNQMGARIRGAGTSTIEVQGVKELHGSDYTVIPDRIEAGTFLVAAAITQGDLLVRNARVEHLNLVISKLKELGVQVEELPQGIRVSSQDRPQPVDIATLPYPGFPTDMQPQMMALLSLAQGTSIITENVFESRFTIVDELNRMGSNIRIRDHHVIIRGVQRLTGAPVKIPDLRGGAALVLAGLAAEGVTEVRDVHHIDRGYENFEHKLRALGADINRVTKYAMYDGYVRSETQDSGYMIQEC
ncbi:MAG: UDP-N-acetylglucosamine 1-carboxyvinyltransferase [Actinomycetota bacterium]|nr:UDP-N-acetylglucosamine 1-carboxyvinyltransferase [Actinomycetota bacterium]